jgi:hypothetical protein
MTGDDELTIEARRLRDEAAADRKAAAADREAAAVDRAQIEHRHREIMQTEAGIRKREEALRKAGEPEFLAREKAAHKALADAKILMASYDKEKHAAAISLNQINEREKAERSAA